MRDEYDFNESRPNPYAKKLRRQVTMNLDGDVIDYFKAEATRTGIPYQNLINLYLSQCVAEGKTVAFT